MARISGLAAFQGVANRSASLPYNPPKLPELYGLIPTPASGLYNVWYGHDSRLSTRRVRRRLRRDVATGGCHSRSVSAGN